MNKLRIGILAVCAFAVSMAYALPYYQRGDYYPLGGKPYVYRQLSLWLISLLQRTGLEYETASILFISLSGVAFVFSLLYMMETAWSSDRTEFIALVLLAIFTMVFQRYLKPYDLPAATFFTLALTCMARWRLRMYLFIFLLSAVNRETTLLLLPVFMVYCWKQVNPARRYWVYVVAQAVIFVIVQAVIRFLFRDAEGLDTWISPVQNILAHWNDPVRSMLGLTGIAVILWMVFNHWEHKPIFLRTAFVILAPSLGFLYIFAGQAFEYRVLAEVFSVTALLAVPSVIKVVIYRRPVFDRS